MSNPDKIKSLVKSIRFELINEEHNDLLIGNTLEIEPGFTDTIEVVGIFDGDSQ